MKRLTVDFNAIHEDTVRALRRHASSPLEIGDRVRLTDEEEHVAEGRVDRLEGDLAYVAVDWDTWGQLLQLQPYGSFWSAAASSYVTGQTVDAKYVVLSDGELADPLSNTADDLAPVAH